jgi:hypothetical protein
MRRTLVLFTLLVLALDAQAGRRRATRTTTVDDVTITFLTANGSGKTSAVIDTGAVSFATDGRAKTHVSVITREFDVRIDRSSGETHGTAVLRAFLESPDPHHTYRVNGILLGSAPVIVDRRAPFGVPRRQRLEITVPASAPEGQLFTSIRWELTSD